MRAGRVILSGTRLGLLPSGNSTRGARLVCGGRVSAAIAVRTRESDERGSSGLARNRFRTQRLKRMLGFLAVALLVGGCASMGGLGFRDSNRNRARPIPLRVVRADAPADYDVLVAELAQIDGDLELAREAYQRAAEKDPESAVIHERLSRVAWQLGSLDAAVGEAELAFALDPDSLRIRLFLGRLYRLRRDSEGLDRVLRDSDGQPLDADSAYVLYQVAFERGDLEQAENLARELATTEPGQLRGVLALASVYEQRAEFDSAEDIVRRGLDSFPDHFLLYMRLAQIERARENRSGEIAVYREVLASHPGHYGILQRLGQAQVDGNDLDAAITTFAEIVTRYPEDLNSLRRLASLEYMAGRLESATSRLEIALKRHPHEFEIAYALGQIYKASGNTEAAIEVFGRIGVQNPNFFDARIQIAAILESEQRYDEALAEIDRLREVRPERQLDFHASALQILGGDFEAGIARLEDLLDGTEDDSEVYYQIGIAHGTHGDNEVALRYMQQVLEAEPNNANALNYIGYAWAEQGENLSEAEELIRRALEISPDDGYITDSLGWVYYKMAKILFEESRKEEALRLLGRAQSQLMQAAELTGGDSVVSEHLGDVLWLRDELRGALERYEEAVGLGIRESEQPMLLEKLEQLRSDLGMKPATGEAP